MTDEMAVELDTEKQPKFGLARSQMITPRS